MFKMKQSDILRNNAENCLRLAEGRSDQPSLKRFRRMAEGWLALAREQDWLDGVVGPQNPPRLILAKIKIRK
jgi:hypothetical protein